MTINSAGGSKIFIGGASSIDFQNLDDAAILALLASEVWTEIGEAEDVGEFGDEAEEITFTALSDGRVRKLKGPKNAGTIAVVTGADPEDAGQDAMVLAEASNLDYNFRVDLNDAISLSGTPSSHYFKGKVMSKRLNVGNVSNVVRRTFNVGINSKIVEVNPT